MKVSFIISILLLLITVIPGYPAERREIYNDSWNKVGNIEGNGKIYDNKYNLKYRIKDNKVYDDKYHLKFRIEGNKIYDDKYHLKFRIENSKIYNNKYNLKYRTNKRK